LREAEAKLARYRDHAGAAKVHLAEREAAVERSQQVVETARREQTARLRERLAGNGGALRDGADDPAEAAAMRDAERARRLAALAKSAQTDIEASVGEARGEVGRAQTQVEKAAQALIEKTRQAAEADWVAAQQRAAELQTRMISLHIDVRYSAQTWPAPLRALLTDPEAVI
jgi:hypothetical protein